MTPERLTELRDKVHHGFNLLPDEAREVFAHYGEPITERRKRCEACGGEGLLSRGTIPSWRRCEDCNGTGYEVAK